MGVVVYERELVTLGRHDAHLKVLSEYSCHTARPSLDSQSFTTFPLKGSKILSGICLMRSPRSYDK